MAENYDLDTVVAAEKEVEETQDELDQAWMTIESLRRDNARMAQKLRDVHTTLQEVEMFLVFSDRSNAARHLSPVRYSPLTERVVESVMEISNAVDWTVATQDGS